jgi:geranylgeranyl pyrophosphate synthase
MDHLERAREEVDRRVARRIAQISDSETAEHFRGGKRLRAGTALLLYEALSSGDRGRDMAIDLASAVEFAHGISLMIDDVLDGDTVRRGETALQARKGTSRTVLEAVGLLAVPYSLASPHGYACTSRLAAAHEEMVRGALVELDPPGPRAGMAAYDRLISMKSGGLFALAARFGAMAAGCCDEKASLAETYGGSLGTVHQLSDDIVDLRSALSLHRTVTGSEAHLFRCVATDPEARSRTIDRGMLSEEAEAELARELRSRVQRAERAARKLAGSVGRCGGRTLMNAHLPIMLSAPFEIAGIMMSGR